MLAGFPSRKFLTWLLISRQVTSSVYVGEKVSDFTQPMRSTAENVDQFLFSSSRVRCSLARQLFNLSLGVWLYPPKTEAAARQLPVTSQLGTPSATAARVRRAEASVGLPSAEATAMAIISRRNMTNSTMAPFPRQDFSARCCLSFGKWCLAPKMRARIELLHARESGL